jgi:NAD(P)-dependent dehydrogenase (short-subunit alcohol dehydrogenase family)
MSRVAVVTGGASGIGLGVAKRFVQAGHRVAVLDIQTNAVKQAAQELGALGIVVDVTDRAAVDAAMAEVREKLGPIQILVTSAGIDGTAPFSEITIEAWNRVLAVNLTGTFHCIQSAIGDMVKANWGRVVIISSSSAQSGAPDRAHYVASKGGLIGLTKALSFDFASKGITVNTIPPSIIDTPMARAAATSANFPGLETIGMMTPVGRFGVPDDVAAACAFLCSDDAGFITGQQIGVNGGWYL